jgi:O-antigen ligase
MFKNLSIQEKSIIFTCLFSTILITPSFSYDAFNLPKFAALVFFGIILTCFLVSQTIKNSRKSELIIYGVCFFFIFWSLLSLFFSGIEIAEGFFGAAGRNTGFLTYFCLNMVLIATVRFANVEFIPNLISVLKFSGLLAVFYGFLQSIGADPNNWNFPDNKVFGYFGNPNFQSSFLGITGIVFVSEMLKKNVHVLRIVINSLVITSIIYVINKSDSKQGFFVLLAGSLIVFYCWLKTKPNLRILLISYLSIMICSGVVLFFDIFRLAPWKSILYEESISYRGDFWRAAWNMSLANPIIGVGFDGYRDNYRIFRDQVAADRPIANTFVDSAHNVLLDILSSGGFPLLIAYLLLMGLTIFYGLKQLNQSKDFDYAYAILLGCWVGYTLQSLISINNIGLAIWGWVLTGSILSYNKITSSSKNTSMISTPKEILISAIGSILAICLFIPPLIADSKFVLSIRTAKVENIQEAIETWPHSVTRINSVIQLFRDNNFEDNALEIARKSIKRYPYNFEVWENLFLLKNSSTYEKELAYKKMKFLDPYFNKYMAP